MLLYCVYHLAVRTRREQNVEIVYDASGLWQPSNSVITQGAISKSIATKGAVFAVVNGAKGQAFTLIGNVLTPTSVSPQKSTSLPAMSFQSNKVCIDGFLVYHFFFLDFAFLAARSRACWRPTRLRQTKLRRPRRFIIDIRSRRGRGDAARYCAESGDVRAHCRAVAGAR